MLKIKFGQISDSTKITKSGSQWLKEFFCKSMFIKREKIDELFFLILFFFLNTFDELMVFVVIRIDLYFFNFFKLF